MPEDKVDYNSVVQSLMNSAEVYYVIDYETLICEYARIDGEIFNKLQLPYSMHEFEGQSLIDGLLFVVNKYVVLDDKSLVVKELSTVPQKLIESPFYSVAYRVNVNGKIYNLINIFSLYTDENGKKKIGMFVFNIKQRFIQDEEITSKLMVLTSSQNFLSSYFYFVDSGKIIRYKRNGKEFIRDNYDGNIQQFLENALDQIPDPKEKELFKKNMNLEVLATKKVGDEWKIAYQGRLMGQEKLNRILPLEIICSVMEICGEKVVCICCLLNLDYINKALQAQQNQYVSILTNAFIDVKGNIIRINLDDHSCSFLSIDKKTNKLISTDYEGGWDKLSEFVLKMTHPDDFEKISEFCTDNIYTLEPGYFDNVRFRCRVDHQSNLAKLNNYFWYSSYIRVYIEDGVRIATLLNENVSYLIEKERRQREVMSRYSNVARALTNDFETIIFYNKKADNVIFYKLSKFIDSSFQNLRRKDLTFAEMMETLNVIACPDDRKGFVEFLNPESFEKELGIKKKITYTFRIFNPISNKLHYCRVQITKAIDIELDAYVIGFENIDEQVRLENAATTDYLTKLNNREGLFEYISTEFELNRDNGKRHFLMLMDCDRFKYINDNYGHVEGDKALIRVASVLKEISTKYENSFVSRHGGDEFLFLVDLDSIDDLLDLMNDIRALLAKRNAEDNIPYNLDISIGSAEFLKDMSFDKVISQADEQMYINKSQKRNRS